MEGTCLGFHGTERSTGPRDRVGFTGTFGVHPVSGVCPWGPDSGPRPARVSGAKGRTAGWGRGSPGTKAAATTSANCCGRRDLRTPGPGHAPAPGESARRWSAPGGRPSPRRPSPPARRPHRPLPRPRSLPPAPRRLRARRTWRRRRRSGGTLYLSTGPTACAGTAASSSSSAARARGGAGARGGRGAGPGGRPPGRSALTGAPLPAVTSSAARPGCTRAPGSRSTPAT